MSLETELRTEVGRLLGRSVEGFPVEKVAARLEALQKEREIVLSAYGYLMWAMEHYGEKCLYKNVLASENAISGYVGAAVKMRDEMPEMLVNAHMYVSKVLANVADLETCLTQLEGMSYPYVLYVLFAAGGQGSVVERYRPEAEEQMKRYPSTLDRLPESYRNVGKELLNADAE